MLINEAGKRTNLTKKAIEYYTLQGLISPIVLENGYRDYSNKDIELLNKISILRKLDVSTDDIRKVLNDTTNLQLQKVSVKKELDYQRQMLKNIATYEKWHGMGYGSRLIEYISEYYRGKYKAMLVGTGEVPSGMRFYGKNGFELSHRVHNFFCRQLRPQDV